MNGGIGRRGRLKICCPKEREGSSPSSPIYKGYAERNTDALCGSGRLNKAVQCKLDRYKATRTTKSVTLILSGIGTAATTLALGARNHQRFESSMPDYCVLLEQSYLDCNSDHIFVLLFAAIYATLAQLVEHLICNQVVVGSSPTGSSQKEFGELKCSIHLHYYRSRHRNMVAVE